MDCSQSGSSIHGILQASRLERGAFPFSRDLPKLAGTNKLLEIGQGVQLLKIA